MYAATHRQTGQAAALKIIFLGKPGLTAASVKVLRGEFKLMSRIDHPNIANIYNTVCARCCCHVHSGSLDLFSDCMYDRCACVPAKLAILGMACCGTK